MIHEEDSQDSASCPISGSNLFIFKFLFTYLVLVVLGLCCCMAFSLAAASGGHSLAEVSGLLFVVASLAVVHRLWGTQASVVVACGLLSSGSAAVVHAFSCPVACGIWVPGSGIKPPSPTLADGLLTTGTREVPVF